MPSERESSPYQLFILGLCLYALAALAVQTVFTLDRETTALLDIVDTGVCAVFFLDFIRSLVRADHRFQYLVTWG